MMEDVETWIEHYFHLGYENKVILDFINHYHGIQISLSTLKRRLQDYGLTRRGANVEDQKLRAVIKQEIAGPGVLRGYRAIWHSLRLNHHIHVPRQKVADILRELNPEGTLQRKRRRLRRRTYTSCGPNFCWHIDGYDKLKPYGFPIHGAIDGYSRKILWLELSRSNNKPEIPAKFYLDSVKENFGCPILVRTDCGTENGIVAGMQSYFRQNGEDEFAGEKSHRYGTSPSNQRIECWWSSFRRNRSSWWIDLFKHMVNTNVLDLGNKVHTECLWFCFQAVIQEDLEKVKLHWNTHRIRKSGSGTIPGVPDILYFLPHQSGAFDCKVTVPRNKFHEMVQELEGSSDDSDDEQCYYEYFHEVMESEHFQYPNTPEEACELFEKLICIACR